MNAELNWANDAHKGLVVGHWQDGVTTGQTINVFMKFVTTTRQP